MYTQILCTSKRLLHQRDLSNIIKYIQNDKIANRQKNFLRIIKCYILTTYTIYNYRLIYNFRYIHIDVGKYIFLNYDMSSSDKNIFLCHLERWRYDFTVYNIGFCRFYESFLSYNFGIYKDMKSQMKYA